MSRPYVSNYTSVSKIIKQEESMGSRINGVRHNASKLSANLLNVLGYQH